MVQGVVVQITTFAPRNFSRVAATVAATASRDSELSSSDGRSSSGSAKSTTGNFTQIVNDSLSWYSTSASASAVCSTGDHMTGFEP